MKRTLCVSVFLLSAALYAKEDRSVDLQASVKKHTEIIDKRENYFQTSTPYKITPNVNPITGDLIEEETDLVVAGSEALSVRRFYNHTAICEPRSGGWRYNPETFLVANFEWAEQETFAAAGEFDGSIIPFKPSSNTCNFDFTKGFCNFNPSGQTHPLNTKIHYHKAPGKEEGYFSWRGEIIDGSGTRRAFDSGNHCWLNIRIIDVRRIGLDLLFTGCTPNCWTPYQVHIYEERKPNGNIICYSIARWKEGKYFPRPPLLSKITAYNADKTKNLGSISFHYNQDKHGDVRGMKAVGSDGRQLTVGHRGSTPILLHAVQTPDKPLVTYRYQKSWINRIEKPEGRTIRTDYDRAGKVAAQYAPLGPNGEMHSIGNYVYHERDTEVYDAEGNKTIYRFNEHKQIQSLETYTKDQLYRIDRLTWDTSTGNLLKKTTEDCAGQVLQITEYTYDKNHNPILERVGDGKRWRTLTRTFSDDGFNLKLSETDREGKLTCYKYLPNTNLLSSELVFEKDAIRQRTFHFYDDCAICIKTIIDDGHTEDSNDLKGVTYRKITQITPKQTVPCFGLPEVIEEKTLDPSGTEILLHKVVYTYTPFGKVLKEEHYDAENIYRYSLVNAYDDRERLTSQTNQLGHTTTFTYDANNNLISITGPKPEQHQEITYDKANRPIRIADWQLDGTVLITEKKYDKVGRVIETIDPCKNITRFEYDALGRLVNTIHPDGAVEKKEYDHLDNVTKETDPEGYETHKAYNCFGEVIEITYPDGGKESFTYNPTGMLAAHTDKNGALTEYTYDPFDHLIGTKVYSSSNQLLKTTTATWTPFQKISETDGALTTTYIYDFAGRKLDEQQAYRHIHYVYDALGRIHITQEGDTQLFEEYDLADQLLEKRRETSASLQSQEAYAYDEAGNCTQVINSQGITETRFNTDGQPLSITDPLGFTTHFTYSYGNVLTQTTTDPKGIEAFSIYDSRDRETYSLKKNLKGEVIQHYENTFDKNGNQKAQIHTIFSGAIPIKTLIHRWEYGPLGHIERFLEADERETRYHYDEKGRLKTLTKPNGCILHHEYDNLGRLKRFYAQDFDYHYTYDQNDHVIAVHDEISSTTTTRSYDPLGNILEERLANGLVLMSTYDDKGRRTRLTLPDASCIDYTYDGHYLYQVKRGKYTHTYSSRNLEGEIVKATLPDAQEVSIERDKLGRYAQYQSPYYTASYPSDAYDGNGNLLHYQFHDPIGETEYTFSYDELNQLIVESDHSYQFDSHYNRLKKDDLDYAIDAFCQVNSDGKTAYEYDASGNLISDGMCKYFYDSLDRLIAIEKEKTRIEYTYDPFNRRLSKTVFTKGKKSNSLDYMWDGENEIGSVDKKDHIQELRILGEGLGAEIGAAVLHEIKGKSYIPLHDHRGSLVTLVDLQTKKPPQSYRYTAFGEELTQSTLSPWRFASKRVDEETGLVYFGRRYYNPQLGRWITQDPQGFADGPNLYAYLHNCPLNNFDPYGLWSWNQMWGCGGEAFWGAGSYLWEGVYGLGHFAYGIGELGYAGLQSAYFQDASYLQNKWSQSRETLSNFGQALCNDPFGAMVPGFMEAWRNPTSPAAWGKAAVDIVAIATVAGKIGQTANIGRVGRIGEVTSFVSKVEIGAKIANLETSWRFGAFKSEAKWANQMTKRGWSSEQITEAITRGKSCSTINMVNKSNPATRYIHPTTGQSVVIDNRTKEILHLGGPGFKY